MDEHEESPLDEGGPADSDDGDLVSGDSACQSPAGCADSDSDSDGEATDGDVHPPVLDSFILIPPGKFAMGSRVSESGRSSAEGDLHQVTITRPLWVENTEVTEADWERVFSGRATGSSRPKPLSWFDSLLFANALSTAAGLSPCYTVSPCSYPGQDYVVAFAGLDCPGFRLPTEAEWEYLARAGTARAFPNGEITDLTCEDNTLATAGWYCGNANGSAHAVQGKAPNAWGLYDMAGNVSEWVWDSCSAAGPAPYGSAALTDPVVEAGEHRIVRGGSWASFASGCRAAARGHLPPDTVTAMTGVRLVRSALP